LFTQSAEKASLPVWPITEVEVIAEDEDFGDLE